ncbi:MAG TPA: SRPBCC family protein [Pirellulales bacterium]|jgi:uncharacterized protein YndB with AHSA1/START domain|nr:SRPBCC family protein [Pirellulales bacterium]
MSNDPTVQVRATRSLSQPAERVFDAWLDPKTAGRWLFATPTGQMIGVEIDARVGGSFVFVDRREGENVEHTGQYLENDRPRRLVFTFAVPKYSKLSTTVTIDVVPTAAGCELTLTHDGVLPEYASRTQEGWGKILGGLAATLG